MKSWPELTGSGNPEAHDYAAGLKEELNARYKVIDERLKEAFILTQTSIHDKDIPGTLVGGIDFPHYNGRVKWTNWSAVGIAIIGSLLIATMIGFAIGGAILKMKGVT
jgi:hypothetical protein